MFEELQIDCRLSELPETVYLGRSDIAGLGIFARRELDPGELVYRITYQLVSPATRISALTDHGRVDFDFGESHSLKIDFDYFVGMLDELSNQARTELWTLFEVDRSGDNPERDLWRVVTDRGKKTRVFGGFDDFMNDSLKPNVEYTFKGASRFERGTLFYSELYATRAIGQDEELLINYETFIDLGE